MARVTHLGESKTNISYELQHFQHCVFVRLVSILITIKKYSAFYHLSYKLNFTIKLI
jgi:hypothetical protein